MRVSPCKGCEKRELGCHDRCEEYLKYKEGRNALYEQRRVSAANTRPWSNYSPRYNGAARSKKKGNGL